MPGFVDLCSVAITGGLLGLDRTAFLQVMVSRPLVGSALVGALLGSPALGLVCGALLELLWLMELPVGTAVPPDEVTAGVLSAAFAVAAPEIWSPPARAALGVLLALPLGFVGRWVDEGIRRWNARLLEGARLAVESERWAALSRLHFAGAARFFLAEALLVAAGAAVGMTLVAQVAPALPPWVPRALEILAASLPAIGAAAVLGSLRGVRNAALFSAGLVGGLISGHPAWIGQFLGREPWRR